MCIKLDSAQRCSHLSSGHESTITHQHRLRCRSKRHPLPHGRQPPHKLHHRHQLPSHQTPPRPATSRPTLGPRKMGSPHQYRSALLPGPDLRLLLLPRGTSGRGSVDELGNCHVRWNHGDCDRLLLCTWAEGLRASGCAGQERGVHGMMCIYGDALISAAAENFQRQQLTTLLAPSKYPQGICSLAKIQRRGFSTARQARRGLVNENFIHFAQSRGSPLG